MVQRAHQRLLTIKCYINLHIHSLKYIITHKRSGLPGSHECEIYQVKVVSSETTVAGCGAQLRQRRRTSDAGGRTDTAAETRTRCHQQGTDETPRCYCWGSAADSHCQWLDIHCCRAGQLASCSVHIPENSSPPKCKQHNTLMLSYVINETYPNNFECNTEYNNNLIIPKRTVKKILK